MLIIITSFDYMFMGYYSVNTRKNTLKKKSHFVTYRYIRW